MAVHNCAHINAINHTARGEGINWWGNRAPPVSSVAAQLIEAANRPSDGQRRVPNDQQREQFAARIKSMAESRQNLPVLCEYTEGGNGLSDQINGHLRGFKTSDENIKGMVQRFEDEVILLSPYPHETYRAVRVDSGVFGQVIKVGNIVTDPGYMSTSIAPDNAVEWLETWTDLRPNAREGQQRVLLGFDEQIPKKMASTDFLPNHVLIKPLTHLRVTDIHSVQLPQPAPDSQVTVVGLTLATDSSTHKIRDIGSGRILFPALDRGVRPWLQNWFSRR